MTRPWFDAVSPESRYRAAVEAVRIEMGGLGAKRAELVERLARRFVYADVDELDLVDQLDAIDRLSARIRALDLVGANIAAVAAHAAREER